MIMPDKDGIEIIIGLRDKIPDVKIIAIPISAYFISMKSCRIWQEIPGPRVRSQNRNTPDYITTRLGPNRCKRLKLNRLNKLTDLAERFLNWLGPFFSVLLSFRSRTVRQKERRPEAATP